MNGNPREYLVFEYNPKYYTGARLDKGKNIDYSKYAEMYPYL